MNYRQTDRREFIITAASAVGGLLAVRANELETTRIVSLRDAHIGTLEIDLRIMNQYEDQPQELLDFYTAGRAALTGKNPDQSIAKVCRDFKRLTLGGPMLGNLTSTSVSLWIHLPESEQVVVLMTPSKGGETLSFKSAEAARVHSIVCDGLSSDTHYTYEVKRADKKVLGNGQVTTAPTEFSDEPFRLTFGTCFHKVGMYRPELMQSIQERGSRAMLILGDSAVDGRREQYGLIQSDYLLRDLSTHWQNLSANVPISATWDDHDYWGDDTGGATNRSNKPINVDGLRKAWRANWNNPERDVQRDGIYFSTRIGPVHYIALDTRSCRVNQERGALNSFLGEEQMNWLKQEIEQSDAECIVISGGTMWSDYISAGKDSWGTWDTEGREKVFQWIDAKKDALVLLLSGDRHGARAFAIPRPNGGKIYELEVAGMGGVPGPAGHGKNREDQLFGYAGRIWAFGELTFSKKGNQLQTLFRLINDEGKELETLQLSKA